MTTCRGWTAGAAAMLLGPQAGLFLWVLAYPHLAMGVARVAFAVILIASYLAGLAGVHLLPVPRAARFAVAFVWTPLAAGAWVMALLVLGCALNRDCL